MCCGLPHLFVISVRLVRQSFLQLNRLQVVVEQALSFVCEETAKEELRNLRLSLTEL